MYKIHNKEFQTQKDLKDYLSCLVKNHDSKLIEGDDFITLKELIHNIPVYKDMRGEITQMTGKVIYNKSMIASYRVDFNIYRLRYDRKTMYENVKDNIFTGQLVKYAPPVKETVSTINYVFKFGKNKGMNIEDINDMSYLYWVTGESSNINKVDKILIKKFIKYGFIPYNNEWA